MATFAITPKLLSRIHHFASFPQTPVSLQQLIHFGSSPSSSTLLHSSIFLSEELPIRLAHRVKELSDLPHGLGDMPSIRRVREWYARSFDELVNFGEGEGRKVREGLKELGYTTNGSSAPLPESQPHYGYSDEDDHTYPYLPQRSSNSGNGNGEFNKLKLRVPMSRRAFSAPLPSGIASPPEIALHNSQFTKLLESIKRRHDPTVATVAQGVLEWKEIRRREGYDRSRNRAIGLDSDVQAWLDRFYMSRIGIRFLIGQHVALTTQQPHPSYVGIVCTRTNISSIISEAIENARFVCEEHYALFKSPPIQLICPENLCFPYVPGHLSHIVFELLKNSLRAVVEKHGVDAENYPPIKIIVVEGEEDITIKISDEGGGIKRSEVGLIWTYMYTTMSNPASDNSSSSTDSAPRDDFRAPMAGFGYGLPLSRLYARYFGGDLRLIAMDGFGTDVYIHLNRLSSSREPLP